MPIWIWCAFEPSAASPRRLDQIRKLMTFSQSPWLILTRSDILPQINDLAESCKVNIKILDEIWTFRHEPSRFAQSLAHQFCSTQAAVLMAPHTQFWMHCLSDMAAAQHLRWIPGMVTQSLPKCARLICAGRVLETLPIPDSPFLATLRLDEVPSNPAPTWNISSTGISSDIPNALKFCIPQLTRFTDFSGGQSTLENAQLVFAGGRGLGSKDNFNRLTALAARYGAGIAASRLAVDLGWCRNDIQVGQTGHTIAPDIYVTFGISGAIQHLAGIRNARKILAINNDPQAPIFHYADAGVVCDLSVILDKLEKEAP